MVEARELESEARRIRAVGTGLPGMKPSCWRWWSSGMLFNSQKQLVAPQDLSTGKVSAVGYGMDEVEQDQHEARLKELFDSFDTLGTGSLGQEELTDLCHVLSLEDVAPVLQQTLLQDNLLGRVHFDQFKEALILILSRTLSGEEHFQESDCLEAQPKYVRGGKRYGRRSLPEFQESVEEFAEVTVLEPLDEEAKPSHLPADDCSEHWKTQHSEEYEAEGQLRFWNPDDLNASHSGSCPPQDWIEEKLQEVCEDLGITRDGHLNRKKLVSICEQYGLQNVDGATLEEVFLSLDPDGTMSVEDFFYSLFKTGKSLTTSASTPYRQLKRHLSMQSFDESGRRTTTSAAMTSTIGFRVFSCLDDGMGHASVERILDTWQEEGIENSQEILKALDFSLDGNVNLTELTLALENELLVTKNGIHQAALASFKAEIRHLLERVDQVVREKEKLRSDLDKAEKLKSLMASEVDDHHAAIERRNEYNLRKLDEEYKERITTLKNELRQEREQILQQMGKQRVELEREIEKAKTEENYVRDRLALSMKENHRLENELLENAEKLAEYEALTNKLQHNLENVLAEKFGDLDPSSAEFFLQEERLAQMRNEYEQQCRLLQDQVDELHSELEEYRAQGKILRLPLKNSLSEELDLHGGGIEPDQGLGSEECNPLNMSIEAELVIEQMKEQHHRDLCHLRLELEEKVRHYERQLDETRGTCEKEQVAMKQKYEHGMLTLETQISDLRDEIANLRGQAVVLKEAHHQASCRHEEEKKQLQRVFEEEKTQLQEELRLEHERGLKARLQQAEESFQREREELAQGAAWAEEKVRDLTRNLEQSYQEQLLSLEEKHALEKEELRKELLECHQRELQEEREKMESECTRRVSQIEAKSQADCEEVTERCEQSLQSLEGRYRQELKDLLDQHLEERAQWEFEKDELAQECTDAQEQLKEALQREKATSLVLNQEREMMEKTYKERWTSLSMERDQLLQDLEDLRNTSESQHRLLSDQILELKRSQERELREQELCQTGSFEQLASQQLERLQVEREKERREMLDKLAALESAHRVSREQADLEKAELSAEIHRLQNTVKDMQQATSLPVFQGAHSLGMAGEEAEGNGAMSLLQQGEQLLEENGDVLLSLQRAHEHAVKENAKMATEISRLQQRLKKLEPGSVVSSCLEEQMAEISGSSREQAEPFLSQIKQGESAAAKHILSDLRECEAQDLGSTGTSSVQRQEGKSEESEISLECLSELGNSEDTRTESWDLKSQIVQLQEQLTVLRADCDRASERKQDLLFDISVLKKKLKMLERIPEASSRYKLLYEDATRENVCLQEELRLMETRYDESLDSNKELTTEVFRLQEEMKKMEEVMETFLSLEKSYDEVKMENEELSALVLRLQGKMEKYESEKLQEENSILRNEITTLNEEDTISNEKSEAFNGSQEELWQKIETVEQEKASIQKMVGKLKKQVSDLKIKNQQLDSENTELSQKNSQNKEELQKLHQRLAEMLCQKEGSGACSLERWEQENAALREELDRYKLQTSTLVASLEAELSEVKLQTHIVEQENLLLKDELEQLKQQHRCPDLSDFQQKMASILSYNEKLLKEKEVLSEELNSCTDKLAKSSLLEHRIATMKQEQKSWEQQSETLKSQLVTSQEKVQNLEDILQNVNLQMSQIKSDLQVTQQEKEALKQEVMSLRAQLQNTCDKDGVSETATHGQQQRLSWDKLDHLMNEEPQLLCQESKRLQTAVQNTRADLTHSREKVRQLESNLLPSKPQKQLHQSCTVKPIEQEKLTLKRECEQSQKEQSPTSKKVGQMSSLERELETIHLENEGLKKKQVRLDEKLMEMQPLKSTVTLSPPSHWDLQLLQQQACPMVPREQFLQLQQQLLQAERRSQHLQEELDNRTLETNTPQGSQEHLVNLMEERMIEVEQKLKLVKRLLQEKVNQLKEQLCRNTKADAMVKDLYVENAHLLKALEMTEQRQKTAEKKNYLLEEKIASLSTIVRNLAPAPLASTPPLRS
ncbi:Ninein [Microtus ochrogaster]|uniref:Ninein n=1 Tax=Microtus ochrogaster TaxID=79684 RepID=A0A8J6GV97_MICOH|nr:Ninein [Microtus ochrogaster]